MKKKVFAIKNENGKLNPLGIVVDTAIVIVAGGVVFAAAKKIYGAIKAKRSAAAEQAAPEAE